MAFNCINIVTFFIISNGFTKILIRQISKEVFKKRKSMFNTPFFCTSFECVLFLIFLLFRAFTTQASAKCKLVKYVKNSVQAFLLTPGMYYLCMTKN